MRSIHFAPNFVRALALTLPLALAVGTGSSAQSTARRPVRVAIPNQFPSADARALVVRYASTEKGDLIVLKEADVSPEAFVSAVALLRHLRKSNPPAGRDEVVTVKGFAPIGRGDPRLTSRLTAVLARLRAQPLARIGNLGQGRWLDLPDAVLSGT